MSRDGTFSLQQSSALFRELPWITEDMTSRERIETNIAAYPATGASVSIPLFHLGDADVPSFLFLAWLATSLSHLSE